MPNNLLMEMEDFVRVVQTTGKDILGRYDGKNFVFPNAETDVHKGGRGYLDVHKDVAQHIFGFGYKERSDDPNVFDKLPALMRLGWVTDSNSVDEALKKLRVNVRFLEIPPFPTTVLEFQRKDAEADPVARAPSPTVGQEGGGETSPVSPASLVDPFAKDAEAKKKAAK
jgi:hypothetical protein